MATDSDESRFLKVDASGNERFSYGQLRAVRFLTPSRGVRVDTEVSPAADDLVAMAAFGAVDRAVVADVAAASVWGLPLPPWLAPTPNRPVSLAVPAGTSEPQRRGVRGRRLRLPEEHLTTHDGLIITTPARTWLDCAAVVPAEYVVAMGDDGLRRGLMTQMEMKRLLHWGFRRRGVGVARRAFPLLDPASASPGESLVRAHLLHEGVPRPECNVDIVVDGEWLGRGDIAWRQRRVVLEYDGLVHLDESQRRRDAQRRNLIQQRGWIVITATADDLRKPWVVAGQVMDALRARGWRPD